jgi:hypothetical protein
MHNADKARPSERCDVIGQANRLQTSKNAKCQVKAMNKDSRGKAHPSSRNTEIRNKPECSRLKSRSDPRNQCVELRLSKAIKKEVRDDKIIATRKREGQCVRVIRAEASIGVESRRFAPLAEKFKHRGTCINCVGFEMRVTREELSEETAISIAQDQCALTVAELWKEVSTTLFQGLAERQVLKPAIGTSDEIEARFAGMR